MTLVPKSRARNLTTIRKVGYKNISLLLITFSNVVYPVAEEKEGIEDRTGTNVVNLRRIIYLTIMNALNYEEAVHKLLKVQLGEGEEVCPRLLVRTVE